MYVIAIPSHARPDQLQSKTLTLLKKHHIPMDWVFVFASPTSMESYRPIAQEWGFFLVETVPSILGARNHIIQFFPDGLAIVELDDDIEDVKTTIKGEPEKSVDDLNAVFEESFTMLGGRGLWGLNARANAYFGSGRDQFGLRSIVNSCLGYFNNRRFVLSVPEKEDFQRCILFYLQGDPILKRGGYGIKTKYWTNKGGLRDRYDMTRRREIQAESARILSSQYPGLVREQARRKDGLVDIWFRGRDPLSIYKRITV